MLTLSEIYIYPIKSLGGIALKQSFAEDKGLKYDRRMMLVDETGKFITQKDYPQLALLKTGLSDNGFVVTDKRNSSSLTILHEQNTGNKIPVVIWEDICLAEKVSLEADHFFSDALSIKCSLVRMPESEKREVDKKKKHISESHLVSFADAYPFLIMGQSSFDDLNSRLQEPVPMDRFRTNFVFTGGEPYCEDNLDDFKIGDVEFFAAKPCARCVITTTDQQTARRNKEPLATLSKYRNFNNKVMFGMNAVCKSTGIVTAGDEIKKIKKTIGFL